LRTSLNAFLFAAPFLGKAPVSLLHQLSTPGCNYTKRSDCQCNSGTDGHSA